LKEYFGAYLNPDYLTVPEIRIYSAMQAYSDQQSAQLLKRIEEIQKEQRTILLEFLGWFSGNGTMASAKELTELVDLYLKPLPPTTNDKQ
jgi:hypothetical protein